MAKKLIMSLSKTSIHIKIYSNMIHIHYFISEFIGENNVLFSMKVNPWRNPNLREDGNSNNMMKQLTWFKKYVSDNEEKVGDGSQVLSTRRANFVLAVTPIWFQIQCNQCHMSSQKVKGSSSLSNHQRWQKKNTSFFINSGKIYINKYEEFFPSIFHCLQSPFSILFRFIHLPDNHQNLSKTSDTWIGCESCCSLLQTNHDKASQIHHNHQFTEYNPLVMGYHQNDSCSNSSDIFPFS